MDELTPTARNLPEFKNYNNLGGLNVVSGWSLARPGDFREFVERGLNPGTEVHESFSSLEDVVNFMRGVGDYSDRNSFFIDERDGAMQQEEGFFSPMYCENCLYRIATGNIEDEMPDPEIEPAITEEQVKSFRPGYDRFVKEIIYECESDPEASISMAESWYEEQ